MATKTAHIFSSDITGSYKGHGIGDTKVFMDPSVDNLLAPNDTEKEMGECFEERLAKLVDATSVKVRDMRGGEITKMTVRIAIYRRFPRALIVSLSKTDGNVSITTVND